MASASHGLMPDLRHLSICLPPIVQRRNAPLYFLLGSSLLLWLNSHSYSSILQPEAATRQGSILAVHALQHGPCWLRDELRSNTSTTSSRRTPASADEVKVYWWYRWHGARRFARWPAVHTCSDGLRCVLDSSDRAFESADAVIVWVGTRPERQCLPPRLPHHLWLVEYSESPAYYPELLDARFMAMFALKTSYELDSDVVLTSVHPLVEGGIVPPDSWLGRGSGSALPSRSRAASAIVWMAGNCDSKNRREELVRRLIKALPPSLPLHSVGRCLHNHDAPSLAPKTGAWAADAADDGLRSKLATLGSYAFCLVLENSIAADYVTEKLYHAFAAGCYPIYYGTRDVAKVLPHPLAALQVLDFPSLGALVTSLQELTARPAELRARQAWRDDSATVQRWWRRLRNRTAAEATATKRDHFCSVCAAVRRARQHRRSGGEGEGPGTVPSLRASRRPPEEVWPALS